MDVGDDPYQLPRVATVSGNDSYGSESEEKMCEAYVTLGRLNHVKMRHQRDVRKLKATLDERVQSAFDAAAARVHGEYESLKETLEGLYRKSIADMEGHKLAVEEPTRECLEVLQGHLNALCKAEESLKALLGDPDEQRLVSDLSVAMADVTAVLTSNAGLEGLQYPKASRVEFPAGRLHNLVIAPKRSGDRRNLSGNSEAVPQRGPSDYNHGSERGPASTVEKLPSIARDKGGGACSCGDGDVNGACQSQASRPTSGDSPRANDAEACGRCACACRSGDVWTAYRTLRSRYRELKERADKEEIRSKVEESRTCLQEEMERKQREMGAELEVTKAEVHKLRAIAEDSVAECKARQRDSLEMRAQMLQAQRRLEGALRDALSSREEIHRRKQYGEELLTRLRRLQTQMAACVDTVGMGGAFNVSPSDYKYDHPEFEEFAGRRFSSGRHSRRSARGDESPDSVVTSDSESESFDSCRMSPRGDHTRVEKGDWDMARERRNLRREVHRLGTRFSETASFASASEEDDVSAGERSDGTKSACTSFRGLRDISPPCDGVGMGVGINAGLGLGIRLGVDVDDDDDDDDYISREGERGPPKMQGTGRGGHDRDTPTITSLSPRRSRSDLFQRCGENGRGEASTPMRLRRKPGNGWRFGWRREGRGRSATADGSHFAAAGETQTPRTKLNNGFGGPNRFYSLRMSRTSADTGSVHV